METRTKTRIKMSYALLIVPLFLCMIKELVNIPLIEMNQFAWFILLIFIVFLGITEKKKNHLNDQFLFIYALIVGYIFVTGMLMAIDKTLFIGNLLDIFCCLSIAYVVGRLPYDIYRILLRRTIHVADVVFFMEFALWRFVPDIYIHLFWEPFSQERNMASFLSPNSYSIVLVFIMMYHIDEFIKTRKLKKLLPVIMLLLPFISTSSKSGIVLLLFGILFEFLSHKGTGKRLIRLCFAGCIFIIIMILLFSGKIVSWLSNYQDSYYIRRILQYINNDGWMGDRGEGYGELFKLFKENPICGVGFSNINGQNELFKKFSSPHSEYLKFLSEGGILGFALLLILFIALLYLAVKLFKKHERKDGSNLLAIYTIMFLVAELFYNYFSTPREGMLLTFFGFGTVCFYKERKTISGSGNAKPAGEK